MALRGKNQSNKDLTNNNLSNTDFQNYNFENSNLSGANLSGCRFTECNFTNTNLNGANLVDAYFENSFLNQTIFINANLENTIFDTNNRRLPFKIDFKDANLKGSMISLDLFEANFTNVNLTDATIFDSKFGFTDFNGANLNGTKFTDVTLTSCNLTDIQITEHTEFIDVNFSESELTDVNLSGAKYIQVNFSDTYMFNCKIINTTMVDVNFVETDLTESELTGNNFTNAIFASANLTDANLSGSNLTNANFSNANLRNVNWAGTNITNADFTNAENYNQANNNHRVNPHEIHQAIVKVINNLPRIFQLMNPNNETVPILNTSLLINSKLDSLVNNLQPTANYDAAFLTTLKQNITQLKQKIDGFGDFTNTTVQEAYRDYTRTIQNGSMQINQMISYPLFFIGTLTPDTICYYLDDWSNGSLTAYDNDISCAKGICERFVMSVAAALQIYFDENTHNDPVLKTNYGEIISLILNKEYNPLVSYLDSSQFKTMVLDKCFQEWYGEHTFDEIAPENVDAELQKFKECVKLKYDALPDKLNPSSDNYEEMVENYIETILKITKGGKKRRKTLRKKKTTKKRKTLKKKRKITK
jgi:uncharacterized protein YjbI with pentapeptide repeats